MPSTIRLMPLIVLGALSLVGCSSKHVASTQGAASARHVYALFAKDQEYAKSAVSATVRSGLPAQALSGLHIVNGRLFLWQIRHKHDVALIEDRLRFAATVAAELPPPP